MARLESNIFRLRPKKNPARFGADINILNFFNVANVDEIPNFEV